MKTWAKRSLRTFLQTAVGYIAVNIAGNGFNCKIRCFGIGCISCLGRSCGGYELEGGIIYEYQKYVHYKKSSVYEEG